ncbi:hypothetical protein [Butyrivibrio sp. MC2013]|uniref:hypothetical protein n=1 Tax=Butyrivibrio sp. MC2013 TaxID=1280686 RepID=UPI000411B139|nr:hypothetical protein [Butyrivibrio sp. MC2013]
MDIEKTKEYYINYQREDTCQCDYCQNLIDEIRETYPELALYLDSIGVDIERPFEASLPFEYQKGTWDFPFIQYLVVGNADDFQETIINNVTVDICTCHPEAKYKGKHFIIELGPVFVKILKDKYGFDDEQC